MKRSLTSVLLLLVLPFGKSYGQVLPFTHYTADSELHPLPSAEVHQVYQDRSGYIWLAVYSSGLVRYDGVRMQRYGTEHGLRDLNVWDMIEDPTGRLWVSSNAGLVVSEKPLAAYDAGKRITFISETPESRLLDVAVNHNRMAVDSKGLLWVGTENLGIVRYRFRDNGVLESDTLSPIGTAPVPGDELPVRSLTARHDGSVWVSLFDGRIVRMKDGKRNLMLKLGEESYANVLYETQGGLLWGGSKDGRVWRLQEPEEGEGGRRVRDVSRKLNSNIVDITSDSGGIIWVSSEGSGMLRIDPQDVTDPANYTRSNGLLGNIVYNALEDRERNIWIAQSGGVSKLRYNFKAFTNLTSNSIAGEQPILPSPAINSVLPSLKNSGGPCSVWAGTSERGITCIRDDFSSAHLGVEEGLASNWVNGLAFDSEGRLWAGTSKGINSIHFGSTTEIAGTTGSRSTVLFDRQVTVTGYESSSILAVVNLKMPGSEGAESIWFPAYHAIYALVDGRLYTIDDRWGLPAAIYHAAAFDDSGHLWVGSRDRGIYRSRKPLTARLLRETTESYGEGVSLFEPWWSTEEGAPSNQIECLLWHDGIMWTGTPRGLVALDGSTARTVVHITAGNGLGADNATSMALSPVTGSLWVGTNRGLSEIDPESKEVVRTVTRLNGLVDNEVWFYGSVNTDRDGIVYFGTAKGITMYDPSEDGRNEVPPVVRLAGSILTENPGERNEFTFEYSALSYGNEREVRYQTRLLGFSDQWSESKPEVRANYTNLPAYFFPETYTFEVRAVNESGVWSEEPLSYAFSVSPAWWLSWWAFLGYFLIFSAGVFIVDRVQRRRLIQKEREAAYLRETELKSEAAIARSKAAEAQAKALQAENELKATELEKARELEKAYYELKSTQSRLIQAEKMASLGRLTTGIAHEMKNPLNFINNFAELSKELVDELRAAINNNDSSEVRFLLESLSTNAQKIEKHGKRADDIVASMMEHSQGGTSGFEAVDLNALVKSYVDLAHHSKQADGTKPEISVSTRLDSRIPPLRLIGRKIGQALQNIIENAFDAVSSHTENGDSSYRPQIEISTRYGRGKVEILITDNGPGIPEGIREKIFEPFYTTKPTGEGTGLGLSFSYEIVTQLHGGELKVENGPSGGASFIMTLPAEEYIVGDDH